jgi:hypothetical protein
MIQRSKFRLCILGAAAATTAVFAGGYAALESPPLQTAEGTTAVTQAETVVTTIEPMTVTETTIAPAPEPVLAPVAVIERSLPGQEPGIIVTEQRLTEDERIQGQVMDALARNPTLTGKVGVETRDQVVNLSGYLMTNGQVMRAGREAGSVVGVRYVVNEIRPRVGPVTN